MRRTPSRSIPMVRWLSLAVAVASVAGGAGSGAALAADAPPGITVSGTGKAKGKPALVEISAVVSGEAELASDAIVKHRDAKRRATKAIEDLKIPALSTTSKGFSVSQAVDPNMQQMMMRGQTPTATKEKVQVTEQLQLVLKDADKLSDEDMMNTVLKIIDAVRDAGLTIGAGAPKSYQQMMMMAQGGQGGAGLATFRVPDTAALRAEAHKKAMEDARAKAQRLAELSGVKLGRIISVQDGSGTTPEANPTVAVYRAMMSQQESPADADAGLSSAVFGDIPLAATLTVQFAIE